MLYFAIHIFFVTYSNKYSFEVTSVLSLSLSLTLPHRRKVCLSDGWDWNNHTWSLKHSVLLTLVLPWVDLRTHILLSDKSYAASAYAYFCLQPHCPLLKTTVENFLFCLNNSTQWFNQVRDAANRHSENKKQSSLTLLIRHPAFCSCPCISDLGFFFLRIFTTVAFNCGFLSSVEYCYQNEFFIFCFTVIAKFLNVLL